MRSALFVVAAVCAAACQATPEQQAARATADPETQALIAARQGAEVDRLCFTNTINGWSELSRSAILLEQGVNEWYKVDLTGTCQPEWAFNAIGIVSRPAGSSCLSKGDRLITDDDTIPGVCYVDRIYEWDETKEPAPSTPPSPDAG